MTGLRRHGSVVVALAVVAASFVATSWLLARPGAGADTPPVRFSTPTPVGGTVVAPPARRGAVVRALALGDHLTAEVGRARATCMGEQGYDQLAEAARLRRPPARPGLTAPLGVVPVEFGPSTRAEARRFGLAGVALALDEGEVGAVVSRDPVFDRLAERCDQWLYDEVAPGLRELQTRAARLSEDVDNAFHDDVVRRLDTAIERRLACVRRHHPALPSWSEVQQTDEGGLLEILGVAAGTRRPGAGVAPSVDLVPSGTVRVFAPPAADTYTPTTAEVGLATDFADCAGKTAFVPRLRRAVAAARTATEARFGARADRLADEAAASLRRLEVTLVAD